MRSVTREKNSVRDTLKKQSSLKNKELNIESNI